MAQPDHEECINDFRIHIESSRIYGTEGSSPKVKCPFIPFRAVEEFFTAHRTEKILDILPPRIIDDKTVQKSYPRVFSILLLIGKATFIGRFIQYQNLNDKHLPFLSRPHGWPHATDDFFPDFYKAQWQFCAQKFTQKDIRNVRFEKDHVLPIVDKKVLSKGESAVIYKIKLHDAYNHLVYRVSGNPYC